MKNIVTAVLGAILALTQTAQADPPPRPDQLAFRALYKELVETDTTHSAGNCTLASQRMAAHLKAAGFADGDINLFVEPSHPKDGGLIATLPGTDATAKPILLLAHIDVVEAKAADWQRDPFTLIEENGYFYARGATDDKAMAAVWVDNLIRYRQSGFKPRRGIRMALTCGEEADADFRGAEWLTLQHKDWIDAAFAINEGAGGALDANGKRVSLGIQAGKKVNRNIVLTVVNPGGHSARPTSDNAVYALAAGLLKLQRYEFPVQFNDATRLYFARMADITGGADGAAMRALLADPKDAKANEIVSRDIYWHSMLRTTCVPTVLAAGEERSALPQKAEANINCRIFPGVDPETVRAAIETALDDPKITVTLAPLKHPVVGSTAPPPLTQAILAPAETVAAELWPGVPIIPTMSTGASDGKYLNAAGIPTYGLSGMFGDPDGDGVHGVNERIRVRSLYEGRDFLYEVVKLYANGR